jgi:hypothetical protein
VAKGQEKLVQLQVVLPDIGFRRSMFFNRFRVERDEGFTILSFGLISKSGVLVDSYCCTFTDEALENNKKSLLEYYGRGTEPRAPLVPWQGAPSPTKSDVADIVTMASHTNHAETALVLFSQVAATRNVHDGKPVPGQAVVLLRSSTDVQKHLIKALYE